MAAGRTSLRVSLSADSPSANYSYDTYDTPSLTGYTSITYLDRTEDVGVVSARYSGRYDQLTGRGDRLYQCEAVGYNANLYNKRITYSVRWSYNAGEWYPVRLRDHMDAIASELGLSLNFRVDDNFQVPCNEPLEIQGAGTQYERRIESHTGTVSELIDRLIGWSKDIPPIAYNVRIFKNKLNVIQRGDENGSVNLDTTGAVRRDPVFTKRLINTEWSGNGSYIYSSDNALTKEPFTGTISFGSRTLTYADGYLQTEVIGNVTTTYTYTALSTSDTENARYLQQKQVVDTDNDTRVTITYDYADTTNEKYLSKETEVHEESADGGQTYTVEETIITEHSPLGNGWYGTTTSVNDGTTTEVTNTSMGQGAPGGRVSQYMVDAQQEGLTDNNNINQRREAIAGVARVRATYPVRDSATLYRIARAIDRYNGATEDTVTLDAYGLTTAVDIDDLVTFQTMTWHVLRNEIEITPRGTVQHLTLIRWS